MELKALRQYRVQYPTAGRGVVCAGVQRCHTLSAPRTCPFI
jgi:hypothetical protein